MARIVFDIERCSKCPSMVTTNQYSSDGWDRMEDWECTDMESDDPEKNKLGRKIAGCVEWMDKPEIPDWCPRRLENIMKKNN